MTPEERAEKSINFFRSEWMRNGHDCLGAVQSFIAAEIRAAVEDATQEALKVRDHDVQFVKNSVDRAVTEAYEKAAKVVQKNYWTVRGLDVPAETELAQMIRALAAEEK